ncbi:MAG: pilus assembly protein PilM [Planctomycetes bacterium]|nr:pilus assembly protein PilM [Planctomycetota bacterium]
MAKAAAVHLSADRFEAIVVEGSPKRWRIIGIEAGEIAAPAEGESPMAPALVAVGAALKKLRAPHDPVCLTLSSRDAVFRKLQLPFTGDEAIRKVLKFESESHLHQFNIDEVVVSHVTIEERKEATDLMVAAVPKKTIRASVEMMEQAGYDPVHVDLDGMSLFNALVATESAPAEGTILALHVGRAATLSLVIESRRLVSLRSMRAGLASLSAAVATDLGVPEAEAQKKVTQLAAGQGGGGDELVVSFEEERPAPPRGEIEKSPAELEGDLVEGRRAELVSRLQREVVRTVAAEARHGLSEILVSGEGAGLAGLIEAIAEGVSVPVRELDLSQSAPGAPVDEATRRRLPIALGAGLKAIGLDYTNTEFRQEELKFAKKLESLKTPLTVLVAVILFAIVLQNIYIYRETLSVKKSLEVVADTAERYVVGASAQYKNVPAKYKDQLPIDRFRSLGRFVDDETKKLKEMFGTGGASFSRPQSSFEATERFFKTLRANEQELGLFVLDRYTAMTQDRPTPSVLITAQLTFFGDNAQDCARRIELLRSRIGQQKWSADVKEASTTPVAGGLTVENLSFRVDLSKEAQQ